MLNGKELGAAISSAIRLKIESGAVRTKAEIARHFGVKPPSIADWVNKGSISKDKLPELWRFFSDVVGCDHWGLSEDEWPFGLSENDGRHQPYAAPTKVLKISPAEDPPEITAAVSIMRSTDHIGRVMALAAIRVALAGHKPSSKANGVQ